MVNRETFVITNGRENRPFAFKGETLVEPVRDGLGGVELRLARFFPNVVGGVVASPDDEIDFVAELGVESGVGVDEGFDGI